MATETVETDMGLGLGVLCTLLAGVAALGMFLGAPGDASGWAFGAAVVFGSLAVVALHAYDG